MPNNPNPNRVNPLPQASIPARPAPVPPSDIPENLYKPPLNKAHRASVKPRHDTAISTRHKPEQPRRDDTRSRQSLTEQQQSEARAIAERMNDPAYTNRLENLLRRQESKRSEQSWQQRTPLMELEHLGVARRSDKRYQIIVSGTQQPFSNQTFATQSHCLEAAAELEQRFELEPILWLMDGGQQEHVDAIVQAAVLREVVELRYLVV